MTTFKLGIKGLSAGETDFIRDLLSFMTVDGDFKWNYAPIEPFDAYIVDAEASSHMEIPYVSDIEIVLAGAPANKLRLNRPIHGAGLKACLSKLQTLVYTQQATSSSAQSNISTSEENNQEITSKLKPIENSQNIVEEKYKLIRWPHQVAIRGSKDRVRLSNFLIGKAWSVNELASASGVSLEECASFIAILKSLQLVSIFSEVVSDRSNVVDMVQSRKKMASHANRGFISSLRRKLGL
ncbi:hypothetical protein [Rhodoferax aquaticus]|uniref:Uncharacterized protein n=1 Tax=Rhodoferax aquaticus TaxID=2527691 RepID=A0A515ES91_9BURK|nr:hypothetical protein [Rhodoferax aquaticus]QDL55536.1 hypothetical protein EXZ61_15885 [Rhodoferax aquaticus]